MPCYKVVDELSLTASKLAKEAIVLREAEAGNSELFDGFRMAYDPMITFGVKQVPEKTSPNQEGTFSFQDFCELARRLSQRELTGNAAKEAIEAAMLRSTVADWNGWYRRILLKDMRCGATEGTINRVTAKKFPRYSIPLFECQLAHDGANHESKIAGNKLIEVKLDGVRVITVVYPDGRVDQFSRNGKELANFPHIREQFASIAGALSEATVFDGEIMSGSFQDLMKQVHRKSDVDASDAVLYLFDWLPLTDFQQGVSQVAQLNRSNMLKSFIDGLGLANVRTLGFEHVNLNSDRGQQRFREINAKAIADGYEGIMIKDPGAHYECKRSVAWLKQKPYIEVSLTVVDTEEGTGKNAGRMGALVCEGEDDGRQIRVNVGSGFTDQQRDELWSARAEGQLVEVRADAITRNQDGTYSLRFPRFKTFRGFGVGDKI